MNLKILALLLFNHLIIFNNLFLFPHLSTNTARWWEEGVVPLTSHRRIRKELALCLMGWRLI